MAFWFKAMPVQFGSAIDYGKLSKLRKAWVAHYDELGLSPHRASGKIRMRIRKGKMPF